MFLIIAQAAANPAGGPPNFETWGTMTMQGAMLSMFAWLVMKGFPSMLDAFRQEAAAGRSWHEKQVERLFENMTKFLDEIRDHVK